MKYLCGFLHTNAQQQLVFIVFEGAIYVGDAYFGEGSGPVLEYINCAGTEPNVTDCSWGSVGQLNCHHGRDVGVICQGIMVWRYKIFIYSVQKIVTLYLPSKPW